jgi:hypothetical protein
MIDFAEFVSWFPSLRGLTCPKDVIAHATSAAATSGSLAAARFVLAVWNPHAEHGFGKFTLMDVASWDGPHLAAFQQWAENPFWY